MAAHLGASATVPSPHLARLHGHGRPTAQFDRASLFVSVAIYCQHGGGGGGGGRGGGEGGGVNTNKFNDTSIVECILSVYMYKHRQYTCVNATEPTTMHTLSAPTLRTIFFYASLSHRDLQRLRDNKGNSG